MAGEQALQQAQALQGQPEKLTVYVLRNNWADPVLPAEVALEGRAAFPTLPRTMLRLSLPPGDHSISVHWASGSSSHRVAGQAGDVRVLRLTGWAFWSRVNFQLSELGIDRARELAAQSSLLADQSR
ncbi:MAG: hypothetical protein C0423_09070 [Methylibium sp.]|nr:hypothetical protein [Methylibium sp.]